MRRITNLLNYYLLRIHTEIEADKIVSHLDDLNYILSSKASTAIPASSTADAKIVEKYTTLLAAFAKTGYSRRI